MSQVLLATLGSLGDLNPALAIAKALEASGHRVRLAANPMHENATRRQELEFISLGRHSDPTDLAGQVRMSDVRNEAFAFMDQANFTQLDDLFADLLRAAASADVLMAPYHVVPAHLVSAKHGIPLLAYTLSPAYLVQHARVHGKRGAEPPPQPPVRWHTALAALRRRVGLPQRLFPYAAVFNDPAKILGLFPKFLLEAALDVSKLHVMGYPQTTQLRSSVAPDAELLEFCDEHTVVFSFGSFVDRGNPRYMLEESVAACRALGLKCLYVSKFVASVAAGADDVLIRAFVDHAAVFPRAGAIVHHGGLGTLMAACAAAKPMVTVPFLYDQPYHAQRMAALVGAPTLPAAQYERGPLINALGSALERASSIHSRLVALMKQEEDGIPSAVREVTALAGGTTH